MNVSVYTLYFREREILENKTISWNYADCEQARFFSVLKIDCYLNLLQLLHSKTFMKTLKTIETKIAPRYL